MWHCEVKCAMKAQSFIYTSYIIELSDDRNGNMTSAGIADLDCFVIASQRFAGHVGEVGLLTSFPSSFQTHKMT
jgi:hypothetical protein